MANILLDAAHWMETDTSAMPPSWWNGSSYDYLGNLSTGAYYYGAVMQYQGTVNAGDTLAFSILSSSADPTEFAVLVNGTPIYTQTLATGQPYAFSTALNAGDTVEIDLGVNDYLYSQDAVLTPVSAHAFWTNFVGTFETVG